MADRRSVREIVAIVVIGCTFGVDTSCLDFNPSPASHLNGASRALDEACRSGRCKLSGAAVVTSGPTADTVGIRLGPGAGSATIEIPTESSLYSWDPEALVAGEGSFSMACGTAGARSAPADYDWVTLPSCSQGSTKSFTLSVDQGSVLEIADVRVVGQLRSNGCSVSGRRRVLR